MTANSYSLEAFLKAARQHNSLKSGKTFAHGVQDYLEAIYNSAKSDDLHLLSEDDLAFLAAEFWDMASSRKPGKPKLRISAAKGADGQALGMDIVEIVTDDRVFLVDSVTAELTQQKLEILALFHPIVSTFRDKTGRRNTSGKARRESMILILIPQLDPSSRKALNHGISETLSDVALAVDDFYDMLQKMDNTIGELRAAHGEVGHETLKESFAFLQWLRDGHFSFLGARSYEYVADKSGKMDYANPEVLEGSSLGILRNKDVAVLRKGREPATVSDDIRDFLNEPNPIIVAKSNILSRVHRRVRMDYIGIKRYDADGNVIGETRFVGLFTAEAYNRSLREVPLLRQKFNKVMQAIEADPSSHTGKRLVNVLETYPRDDLWQIEQDDLLRISQGIAHLFDRPRTRVFVRRDRFDRFISALVYVPREQYNTALRRRIGKHLKNAWGGRLSAFYPAYGDDPLARVHFIIGLDPNDHPEPDLGQLEDDIAEMAQSWIGQIQQLARSRQQHDILGVLGKYETAFSAGYKERYTPAGALADIEVIETLGEDKKVCVRVHRRKSDSDKILRAKFYHLGQRLELSDLMPMFENMGLHVAQETGYKVAADGAERVWVHDYEMYLPRQSAEPCAELDRVFEEAFLATWGGRTENDGFNALVPALGASWREAAFIRTLARYRQQSGMDPSEVLQIRALTAHPEITRKLLELKTAMFDPDGGDIKARRKIAETLEHEILDALTHVASLDDDRVLRRLLHTLKSTLRTNYYQTGPDGEPKTYISIKLASRDIEALPNPKPYREIFVWAPHVEGVHLRFGPIARGGLRWSDRRDDFRTEVLGLVKAQQVKNAVIVPVGSKGGFYPKQLPDSSDRDAFREEGIRAYKTFISGLLDLTDNYEGTKVLHPARVVRWDDDDPYLVVAADKGTATFSDIANGVAREYGFWLDDAFASGGSAGYDHKAMGITARGGWEAVKRHFREMGKDIQSEPFDVIGIGDMSGDVFGNGMLLSKFIRLKAAFDHRDIFIDPDPNPESGFEERQRLFDLPRSSWQDYDKRRISKGGGVFSRSAKSIELTDEIKSMTGLSADQVTPDELIHALLKSQTELLWFGGIGTYVKAASEDHMSVGDKTNDLIRVNAGEMQAKVIGEGANLGITQAGRIAFARSGGRINTDAVDNSAGVDSSDHEVNIKILTRGAIEGGQLEEAKRNKLLESMTDDVAELVLRHNYDQTGAISLAESRAAVDLDAHTRFMDSLEAKGRLNRQVEGLPTTEQIRLLKEAGKGLTRPEIAVLVAYAKIELFDEIVASKAPDDPFYVRTLRNYFPDALSKFDEAMASHRLRREIIATRLSNLIVDIGGPVFMFRLREQTNMPIGDLAKAFTVAFMRLNIADIRARSRALDNEVAEAPRLEMADEIAYVLYRTSAWMARRGESGDIQERIDRRGPVLDALEDKWLDLLSTFDRRRVEVRKRDFVNAGAPKDLARDVALLRSRGIGFDITALAEKTGWTPLQAGELFFKMGARFRMDRLRAAANVFEPDSYWERIALRRIVDDLYAAQGDFALAAAKHSKKKSGQINVESVMEKWITDKVPGADSYDLAIAQISQLGGWSLAKFTIANAHLRELMT